MDENRRYIPTGTHTYPADADTLGIEPETIIREAINKKEDYKSKKEAPVDKVEAMVNAQMITEMMDKKLQI
ncbi:MAG TPA: hypothetical protein VEF53_05130 [Patescibacteria group bacterium]|nr:hypothetical protein [Patescibacteria group bacterium]